MLIRSPSDFRDALGYRRSWSPPDGQWMGGPFDLDVQIANGSATDVDCTTEDAWFGDESVRQAYNCTNGGTTKMKAVLHLEAVELLVLTGATAALDVDTMDNIILTGTRPYIEVSVGSQTHLIGLTGAISMAVHHTQETQTTGADGEFGTIQGAPKRLPIPLRIDLENNTFKVKTLADCALGAAADCALRLWGVLLPGTVGVSGHLPGSCGTVGEPGAPGRNVDPTPFLRGQSIQSIGVFGFGKAVQSK